MDIRVAKLEAILPTLATKTDIAETKTAVAIVIQLPAQTVSPTLPAPPPAKK